MFQATVAAASAARTGSALIACGDTAAATLTELERLATSLDDEAFAVHPAIDPIRVRENQIVFGGRRLDDIISGIGRTPAYVYARTSITERVRQLRSALGDSADIHYAMKANPHPEVVAFVASLVDGVDVASAGELQVALQAQVRPDGISFAGPGKQDFELQAAVDADVAVNVESATELERLARIGRARGRKPRVGLRVNPPFELKSSGMRMGGGASAFGIDSEQVPDLLRQLSDVSFEGFHIFAGSQSLKADAICDTQRQTVALALALAEGAGVTPRWINIGGGFGIPYFRGDARVDLTAIGANVRALAKDVASRLPRTRLVIELGRFLVGEAGIYVCRITDIKVSRGEKYLITDGGLHHHLAASGNFGQVIRKNYPIAIGNRLRGEVERVNVVGPLCTPLDVLGAGIELPRASVGDLIVVFQSGAYGFSASPRSFLGHREPIELLI